MADRNTKKIIVGIRTVGVIMVVVGLIMTFFMQFSIHDVKESYDTQMATYDSYLVSQSGLVDMKVASDALSERARNFVSTGDLEHLDRYYLYYLDENTRTSSMNSIIEMNKNVPVYNQLVNILVDVDNMSKLESEAILLALYGYEIDENDFPDQMKGKSLSAEYSSLSNEEKIEKSRSILFGDNYQNLRNDYTDNLEYSIYAMAGYYEQTKKDNQQVIYYYQNRQRVGVSMSFTFVVMVVLTIWFSVIRPLSRNIDHIERQEFLDEKGLKDMRILARAYNTMYENVKRDNEQLSYEASHDSLTGLKNRNAYYMQLAELNNKTFSFLLIDVDNFKNFNDSYGHDVGDRVLMKISRVLQDNFRMDDAIYRLGGDEIAIVLLNLTNKNRNIIDEKIGNIRNDLLKKDDDVPEIRISVGVTFSSGELDIEKIYKEADIALYQAKEEKNTLVYYEDVVK